MWQGARVFKGVFVWMLCCALASVYLTRANWGLCVAVSLCAVPSAPPSLPHL